MKRVLYTLPLIALLAACGAPDAAQTNEAMPAAAYPSPLPATPSPPKPSATPFYTPIPSDTPEVSRSPTPTTAPMTLLDTGRPLSQLERLAFADNEHGWLFGYSCAPEGDSCTPELDTTDNGGQSWRRLPTPAVQRLDGSSALPSEVSQLVFSGLNDGWLVSRNCTRRGAEIQVCQLIAFTHDGGHTWREHDFSGRAGVFGFANGVVWFAQSNAAEQQASSFELHRSDDGGATWQTTRIPLASTWPHFNLEVHGADAWLFEPENYAPPLTTSDGGQTWSKVAMPCQAYGRLAPLDHNRLWALCVGQPGTQMQEKELYQSSDGGFSWSLVTKSSSFIDQSCQGVSECTLPLGGYAETFIMVSPTTGFISYGQYGLGVTRDGGRTWNSAIPFNLLQNTDYIFDLVFTDAQHGWVATNRSIYRTADGGATWDRVAVP